MFDTSVLFNSGCSVLSSSEPDKCFFVLLNDLDHSILRDIGRSEFGYLQRLLDGAKGAVWAKGGGGARCTSVPDHGLSDGLCRVVRRENNSLATIALEQNGLASTTIVAKVIGRVQDSISSGVADSDHEYMVIDGSLCIGRLRRAIAIDEHLFQRTASPVLRQFIKDRKLHLQIRALGLLDTIQFQEHTASQLDSSAGEIDVEVKAFGLNYRGCLTLLRKMSSDVLESECSGIVRAVGPGVEDLAVGDRVMVGALNIFRSCVRVRAEAAVRIPDTMTFSQAAAVFNSFCTAYYSLYEVAHLRKEESILIHAAAGATGQAMIEVAQFLGATICHCRI